MIASSQCQCMSPEVYLARSLLGMGAASGLSALIPPLLLPGEKERGNPPFPVPPLLGERGLGGEGLFAL